MATLNTQYQNYLKDMQLTVEHVTYDYWLYNIFNKKFEGFVPDDFQIGPDGAYNYEEDDNIILKPEGKFRYLVFFKPNMVCLGAFSMDVDGYYHFWMNEQGGSWASYELRMMADALDKINKPYDDFIKENLK
jgi:hypothetical protein